MGMRIGILGAHGTGKTTLARMLAEKMNLPLIEEVAMELIAERGHPAEMSSERALRFQQEVLRRQMELEAAHDGFVSDRTVIDNLTYWIMYGLSYKYPYDFHAALEAVREHLRNRPYDVLISVPVEFPNTRPWDPLKCESCRYLMHYAVTTSIRNMCPETPMTVVRGAPENRLRQALEFLRGICRVHG